MPCRCADRRKMIADGLVQLRTGDPRAAGRALVEVAVSTGQDAVSIVRGFVEEIRPRDGSETPS